MLCTSFEFIYVFLPVSLAGFFIASRINKNFVLLWLVIVSVIFYAFMSVKFLPVLILSLIINYFMSLKISRAPQKNLRKFWLITGIIINFAVLIYFKLINILPPGISFYTFTQTAYLIEIYRESIKSESFLNYSSCITFFPCITSGPIVDCRKFLPELKAVTPDYDKLAQGLTLFIIGLFKKIYFADSLAPIVNNLFAHAGEITFIEAWGAALAYSMQLYFDFSGYSDMALGLGLMFDLNLPVNFDSPYKSLSIIDFWRRWHISLGRWIRDYIYIPLGGSREGDFKRNRNVIIAMLFTGLWHGFGLTFILWGFLHGIMLAINHQWRKLNIKLPVFISWLITFICVTFGWVIFRAKNLNEAVKMLSAMINIKNIVIYDKLANFAWLNKLGFTFGKLIFGQETIIFLIISLIIVLIFPNSQNLITKKFKPGYIWLLSSFVLAVIAFFNFSGVSDFLYFQF